jgi:pimeloyl-ACP methyl ester carboxylesterase
MPNHPAPAGVQPDLPPNGARRRDLLIAAAVGSVAAAASPAAAQTAPIWSAEYWAHKGDVALYLYRKRVAAPAPNQPPLPVLFLVHGSSVSSRPSFDLTVPGAGEYSLMDVFARYGFDVWTMDFEGYGRSSRTAGNSDIASGVADLAAAIPIVAQETGQQKFHFMGESSGAIRAAAFASAHPERIDRLVLEAFTYTGKGSPTLTKRAEQLEYYRTHNRRPRDAAMIRSIFTRDRPGTSDMRVADAMVAAEMPYGDSVPSGTYLDMTANLPVIDPAKVLAPVMVVRGQYDGIATEADLIDFFQKLPNPDRQFVILPGAAHSIVLSVNRGELWHSMNAFLTMPKPVQV